jgi:RHS repeat-associated protein
MIKWHNEPYERYMHWDEENRLKVVYDAKAYLSSYLYDAAGERTLKLQGANQVMLINGQQQFNFFDLNNFTLYTSPYMVMTPKSYTKHYYIEDERVISKIGGGMAHNIVSINDPVVPGFELEEKTEKNINMMYREFETLHVNAQVDIQPDIDFWLHEAQGLDEHEKFIYFYHKDHLGSSAQISDIDANIVHHIEYMPYGENFFEKRSLWATRYKFNAKEKDEETGLYYYGARYYTPDLSVWLSVDPMSDEYPGLSAYNYCANNPVMLVDPDGRAFTDFKDKEGKLITHIDDGSNAVFKQTGKGSGLHYEFDGFDKSQGGKNKIVMTSAVQEQQNMNNSNPDLNENSHGNGWTYCNVSVQNVQKTIESATKDKNVVTQGKANQMIKNMGKNQSYQEVNYNKANQAAKSGKFVIAGYFNPTPKLSGHVLSFSVGTNIGKGQMANIGPKKYTGFVSINRAISSSKPKKYFIYIGDNSK